MRPIALEMSGFGTFRDPTVVAFDDANYFALVGPTGSGKSTIIDAVCFALYGSVPRYENENLVAPVISQGGLEARVRLDFAIGTDTYTAVRVVRRSGKGATTKEARLERGGEVLAGTADELTERVRALVGLTFSQFTKCVVLPQGEFARFLHDKPAGRQDLLVRLLNLEVYERMRQTATHRAVIAKGKAEVAEQRLAQDLAFATEQALEAARATATKIEALRARVVEAIPVLEEIDATLAAARGAVADAAGWVRALADLAVPAGVQELATAVAAAEAAVSAAEKDAAAARRRAAAAIDARGRLPQRDPLVKAAEAHARRAVVAAEVAAAVTAAETARAERAAAAEALAAAEGALAEVQTRLKEAEAEHAAHVIARGLKSGDPCPVCAQTIATLPPRSAPPSVSSAEKGVGNADKAASAARARAEAAAQHEVKAASIVEVREKELASLDEVVAPHPDPEAVAASLAAIAAAEAEVEEAHEVERAAHDALDQVKKLATEQAAAERDARAAFAAVRDRFVALGAPPAEGRDLAADWAALTTWAGAQRPLQEEALARAEKSIVELTNRRAEIVGGLEASCRECDIEVGRGNLLDVVSAAHARAAAEVERIDNGLAQARALRAQLKELVRSHALLHELANHLSARNFEKWLVNEALRRLVVGASEILADLSGGQYALTVDDSGNFLVTDHHNADERRSARTLSGGETFLASLALALALADQLSELAAKGAARLDAIFLDEGFGTLDPETLDTVAATVENLAARGRMVGIVTHVRELAERVPVQFRVKKDPRGSSVAKVTA